MVLDPCLLEENVEQGEMTIVMNVHREVCTLSKAGGAPMDPQQLVRCSQIALVKATELTTLIRNLVVRSVDV
jgi:exosome complex component RRP45